MATAYKKYYLVWESNPRQTAQWAWWHLRNHLATHTINLFIIYLDDGNLGYGYSFQGFSHSKDKFEYASELNLSERKIFLPKIYNKNIFVVQSNHLLDFDRVLCWIFFHNYVTSSDHPSSTLTSPSVSNKVAKILYLLSQYADTLCSNI